MFRCHGLVVAIMVIAMVVVVITMVIVVIVVLVDTNPAFAGFVATTL